MVSLNGASSPSEEYMSLLSTLNSVNCDVVTLRYVSLSFFFFFFFGYLSSYWQKPSRAITSNNSITPISVITSVVHIFNSKTCQVQRKVGLLSEFWKWSASFCDKTFLCPICNICIKTCIEDFSNHI